MHEFLAARHLVEIIDVAQQRAVEIAVPDMTYNRRLQIEPIEIRLGLDDTVGEPRNRHTDIGCHNAGPGSQRLHGPVTVVPRLPEPIAVLRSCGPTEFTAAAFVGDLAEIP